MTPLQVYYSKIFGIGLLLGAGMEAMLIKSNYCKFVLSRVSLCFFLHGPS
jgi:hypothetical protein